MLQCSSTWGGRFLSLPETPTPPLRWMIPPRVLEPTHPCRVHGPRSPRVLVGAYMCHCNFDPYMCYRPTPRETCEPCDACIYSTLAAIKSSSTLAAIMLAPCGRPAFNLDTRGGGPCVPHVGPSFAPEQRLTADESVSALSIQCVGGCSGDRHDMVVTWW